MKIVIDTNVLVASLFNKKSASAKIIEEAGRRNIRILWDDEIKKEVEFILRNIERATGRKFGSKGTENIFLEKNRVENPPEVRKIKDDPEDDKFLSCAKGGEADYIISNDEHLLNLGRFENIPILKPSHFLGKIRGGVLE